MKNPKRIQRKRTKGWRMPPNTVYVGRPTRWGNPFQITPETNREEAVELYSRFISSLEKIWIRKDLRGKNLACFCPLNVACHADILLKIANEKTIDDAIKEKIKLSDNFYGVSKSDTLSVKDLRKAVETLEKAKTPDYGDVYKINYVWENSDGKIRCAWCGKEAKDIRFPNLHIYLHDLKQKLWQN